MRECEYVNVLEGASILQDRIVVSMIQPDVEKWLRCSDETERLQALDRLLERLANIPPVNFATKKRWVHNKRRNAKGQKGVKAWGRNGYARSSHALRTPSVGKKCRIKEAWCWIPRR